MQRSFESLVSLVVGCCAVSAVLASSNSLSQKQALPPLELRDGDRVVFVGDGLIEQEQAYGSIEAVLRGRFPKARLTVRNLGWSGDTVAGLSRAYFDPPAEGTKRQREQIRAARPTVLIVGYGMSDSFTGVAFASEFAARLEQLLDEVTPGCREVVLATPVTLGDFGRPAPDPAEHNRVLSYYRQAMVDVARRRKLWLVKLDEVTTDRQHATNGIVLNRRGYEKAADLFETQLFAAATPVIADDQGELVLRLEPEGKIVARAKEGKLRVELTVDGRVPLADGSASRSLFPWLAQARRHSDPAAGVLPVGTKFVLVTTTSEGKPVPVLEAAARKAPVTRRWFELLQRKNHLFFQSYRPQNITYLLGFRRYEQGQNAKELDDLARLAEAAEAQAHALAASTRLELTAEWIGRKGE